MTPYEKIYLMNSLIGHEGVKPNTEEFWTQIRNQSERVLEESEEAHDEAIEEDILGLINEVSDIMVVAIGMYQKLQLCGIDMPLALDRVCDANLSKFHRDSEEANKTFKFYQDQGIETFVRLNTLEDGSEYYAVIRKSDGKLMKPYDFEKASNQDIADMAIKLGEVPDEESDED